MWNFIKREAVLCAAGVAAVVSSFFVRPSKAYLEYIDFRVLALLFCLMLTVAGAKQAGVFDWITGSLLHRAGNTRTLTLILCGVCFFASMLITNDVALITVVPLALITLSSDSSVLICAVVNMTIAANLGSMLTPIGNPQNLYLYTTFEMPLGDFFRTMLLPSVMSAVLIALSCLLIRRSPVSNPEETPKLELRRVLPWGVLFLVCIACVVRVLDWRIMLLIVAAAVVVLDRKLFLRADYSLLLTFVAFFIFVGNMKVLPAVRDLLSNTVTGHESTVGVLLSQIISNVPAAVLLSGFCRNPAALLVGVNLGGLGTPIASMASLISYKLYVAAPKAQRGKYMGVFLAVNFAMLALLWGGWRLLAG